MPKIVFKVVIEEKHVRALEIKDDTVFKYRLERIIRQELRKYGDTPDGLGSVEAIVDSYVE